MATTHEVEEGECLSSISFAYGFFVDTLWDHPDNAELKQKRKNPTVLMAGDQVAIPDKREKKVSLKTGATHTFRRKGVPAQFKARLMAGTKPRANLSYVLEIGERRLTGATDGDGVIQQYIPPDARMATLRLLDPAGEESYRVLLGHVDPADTATGVQARLCGLGFYDGEIDGTSEVAAGVRGFQRQHGLTVTGDVDDATRSKLVEEFGA